MKLFTIILFAAVYVLMLAIPKHKHWFAIAAALILIISGAMPVSNTLQQINWNVLMMLSGTMGTVALFIDSKMPNRMADLILKKTPDIMWVAVALSLFAGIVSAFVDNVATVLMIAPVALAIAKRLNVSPIPLLVCISVSSNLQGAATLVGDTTSILLGDYAKMDFLDFLFMDGRLSIFWAVELGALATVPVIMVLFRKERDPVEAKEPTKVQDYVPSILLVSLVVLLIAASFIPNRPELTNGYICLGIFLIGQLYTLVIRKKRDVFINVWKEIDLQTLSLLAALFVVIGTLTYQGVIDDISRIFVQIGGSNLFLMYSLIVWGSVLFSAFIDNIPYVATMLPVVASIAQMMQVDAHVLFFGLLVGSTLGGNLTPVGASANIAAIGILQKNGYEVKSKDFLRIGVPFTLIAVLCGYLFCWFVWA